MARIAKSSSTVQAKLKALINGPELIKMLSNHALTGKHKGEEVTALRLQSAMCLLNKILSNAPTDVAATVDASVTVVIKRFAN